MENSIFAEGAGYVRGRFVPSAEATLPVPDWGFTRSDVVYDVVHVFKGGFFRLSDHLPELAANLMGLTDPHRIASPRARNLPHSQAVRAMSSSTSLASVAAHSARSARAS